MATAGQGARQQQITAQRRVQEAERQLAAARAREHAWSTGAAGEEQVAATLAGLEPSGWVVLHDVAWPGRPHANLDHVLVGPGGVLIVDTKNWSGTVTVEATRGLRCDGYRMAEEVAAVEAARQAVLPLVPTVAPTLASPVSSASRPRTRRPSGWTAGPAVPVGSWWSAVRTCCSTSSIYEPS